MCYQVFVVLVSVVMLMPVVLAAQDDETWYFAWKPETGEVVAYTAEGEVNTILEDGGRAWGWRLDSQTAVVYMELEYGEDYGLYKLTPETAQLLIPDVDPRDFGPAYGGPARYIRYSAPFLSLTIDEVGFRRSLLINIETGVVENFNNIKDCCRFSEAGEFLRFVTVEEQSGSITLRLWERILATGETRVIHRINSTDQYAGLSPDTYGDRWLFVEDSNQDHAFITITMLYSDGRSELIAEETPDTIREWHHWRFLDSDLIFSSSPLCQHDCFLQLSSPIEENPISFILPPLIAGEIGSLIPIYATDNQRLLINRTLEGYWLLSNDEAPVFIGAWKSGKIMGWNISTDGHWLLVLDDSEQPEEYRVWDNFNAEYVITDELPSDGRPVGMTYNDADVMVQNYSGGRGQYYRSSSSTVYELPNGGAYVAILENGNLLFNDQNIYSYNPEQDLFTLLVDGAGNIGLQELVTHSVR
jgi:hypothetical protein